MTRLVVVVTTTTYQSRDYLIAYGIDPQHVNPVSDTLVFERLLPIDGLGEFLRVLIDGEPAVPAVDEVEADPVLADLANDSNGEVIANSVDISNPPTPTPGPKVAVLFAYASAITSDTALAELGGTEQAMAA